MPASHILLTAFVSEYSGSVSGKPQDHQGVACRAQGSWHDVSHAPWCGDDRWLELARTTANKQGSSLRRPPRPPATTEHLSALRKHLDISQPHDAATWAIATAAFWGCRRLGELTVPSIPGFSPSLHVHRSVLIKFSTNPDGSSSASLHLPWTKTTKQEGGSLVLTGRSDHLCPVQALKNIRETGSVISLSIF
ncbi:hypothetical protein BD779DRAFT_1671968 [Infundibulicybe gibba]|nr:hypothetical protein BD779DRAFT_1671968 [Infundibulicybe gibba]